MFSRPEGGFANLAGSATQGREHLLIDDAPPPERPPRRPLREEQAPTAPAPDADAQDPAAGAAQDPAQAPVQ